MKKALVIYFLLLIVALSGCDADTFATTKRFFAMGTVCEIRLFQGAHTTEDLTRATQGIEEETRTIESIFSLYDTHSLISALNASGGKKALPADDRTRHFFRECAALESETQGYFSITMGTLTRLWGFGKDENLLPPSKSVIAEYRRALGMKNIDIDDAHGTIAIKNPRTRLDMNAVVPGLAVDRAIAILKGYAIAGIVNMGGEVGSTGAHSYVVGIKHPRAQGLIAKIAIRESSCATSGDYEKSKMIGSKRITHILDPVTGAPIENHVASATVIAPRGIVADALSTAAMAAGYPKAFEIMRRFPDAELVLIVEENGGLCLYAPPGTLERLIILDKDVRVRSVV
jgi:thiamine biosynthesis lipoprotein